MGMANKRMSDDEYRKAYKDKLPRGRWVSGTGEHEERPGQTLLTRDHEIIRRWAEERGAKPSTVPGTEHDGHPGVLRFDFPGYSAGRLVEIPWEEWFGAFDDRDLIFMFQEHLKNGNTSNFFRFNNPHREDA